MDKQIILGKIGSTKFACLPQLQIEQRWCHDIAVTADGLLSFLLRLPFACLSLHEELAATLRASLLELSEVTAVEVAIESNIEQHVVQPGVKLIPQIKNIIAVASGKGGVGKSTTAVNLALALQQEGASVGILDADIYGPSIPTMLNVFTKPLSKDNKTMEPVLSYGLQVSSIGLLVGTGQAMIWRAPMVVQALTQLLKQTNWRNLDYLVIDLPPGTGDVQLTMAQKIPVTGAVIVTTPQDIALIDASKGINMFSKVNVSILGLVENMSYYRCPKCGNVEHIFAADGGKRLAEQLQVDMLGSLPLDIRIRQQTDVGKPTVISEPQSNLSAIYRDIARQISYKIAMKNKDFSAKLGQINVREVTNNLT